MSMRINIVSSTDPSQCGVSAFGNDVSLISNTERNTFQLSDGQLKRAVERDFGRSPLDAFLRETNQWGGLYGRFGWQEVSRTLRPVSSRVLSQNTTPSVVMSQDFVNDSSVPATFNAAISQSVENTVTTGWSTGGTLSVGGSVEVGVRFLGIGGTATASISYEQSWGISGERSTSVVLGSASGVEVTLEPGQAVTAELVATRGTMRVEVSYAGSLSGHCVVNYNPRYQGHHFWALPITRVMNNSGINNSIMTTQTLDIGFYSNSSIIIRDKRTHAIVRQFDCDNLFGD
ncbi:toxin ETX/toxin MTX2 [Kosakonia arachidis]|uniref:Toxin ETX/toxin MTX2 n=1 Tax=Kosakonia arachidis TaxID=551989 RepID=A0A1I6ZYT9_9ENTR|nr:ETX/MTX2 family pore-forming toxin [Kosakonia arachidis]SFT67860.1 toxin ETX/toxin MTX2 [Kosakonia arachidis]